MFNSLSGTITGKFPNTVYLENNGIEWELFVPDSALDALPAVGQSAKIYTWLLHREDSMKIFGFSSVSERRLFLDLLKVDGVGAKGAVKILSNISGVQLAAALDEGNLAALEKIPGIGKKTAGKMLLALKGKLSIDDSIAVRTVKSSAYSDVVDSLVNMGYDKKNCETVIEELSAKLACDEEFKAKDRQGKEELLFKRALVALAR